MRATITIAVACLALAGCKRSSGAPSCEQVAAHVQSVAQTAASADSKGPGPMHQLVRERCTTDRWDAQARTCMRGITGLAGIASCRDVLTPDQANTLAAAAAFAMQQMEPRKSRSRPAGEAPPVAAPHGIPAHGAPHGTPVHGDPHGAAPAGSAAPH